MSQLAVHQSGPSEQSATAIPTVSWYLKILIWGLLGYAIFGKTFAYIGFGPVRVGEVLLMLGVLSIVTSPLKRGVFSSPFWCMLALWMVWSAMCTLPYLGEFGIEAARDGATWGYGIFAFVVAAGIVRSSTSLQFLSIKFRRFANIMVPSIPFLFLLDVANLGQFGELSILKPGDAMVHVVAITVGLAVGLIPFSYIQSGLISVSVLLIAAKSRGATLAFICGLSLASLISNKARRGVLAIFGILAYTGFLLAFAAVTFDVRLELSGGRTISVDQLAANVASIFVEADTGSDVNGTKEWRMNWWTDIVNYTIHGEYALFGKGYGINLADSDGYQVIGGGEALLRNPHSIHMTVLARSGIPGFALWALMNIVWVVSILRCYMRARARDDELVSKLSILVFVYWVAMQVNASFDVYIEGPMGGIWFWCLMGLGGVLPLLGAPEVSATNEASKSNLHSEAQEVVRR